MLMMEANYPSLCRDGKLELFLVWEALSVEHDPERLYGFFLKLQEAGAELGVPVGLPEAVQGLSEGERARHIDGFLGGPDGPEVQGPVTLPDSAILVEGEPGQAPLVLGTGDLVPAVPEELKQRIRKATLDAVQAAPAGALIGTKQLNYLVDSNFDLLCDGQRFNFDPLLEGLRERAEDKDIYIAFVQLRGSLKEIGIEMDEPSFDLDTAIRDLLISQAVGGAVGNEDRGGYKTGLAPPPSNATQDPKKEVAQEKRLKTWGLHSNPRTARLIRVGALLFVSLVAGGWLFLTRPNRVLDPKDLSEVFPLATAQVTDGFFAGVVDQKLWDRLKPKERVRAIKDLEANLLERGLVANSQVRDQKGQLVVVDTGKGRLAAAVIFAGEVAAKLLDAQNAKEARAAKRKGGSSAAKKKPQPHAER